MIASALRPLMSSLRLRSRRRRLTRQELVKLVSDANRRSEIRFPARLPRQFKLTS
ncbi:MAG TPA: hypothetical protein VFK84_08505 [Burkholderiales bacterium]|nr:hypothetical protein [Burkholderiales bacterium]